MSPIDPIAMPNAVTPFLLEQAGSRGRIVRLGETLHTILSRYEYPDPVAHMLGELLLVAAMLSTNLQEGGILTIQLRGSGPVPLVVVDAVHGGGLRGMAELAPHAVAVLEDAAPILPPSAMVGKDSYLVLTLDPGGEGMERYQGVVALEGETIADSLLEYFTQSQQIDVRFDLAVAKRKGVWVAGGLMLERMPHQGGIAVVEGEAPATAEEAQENWITTLALIATLKHAELLDPALDGMELLYRLFHEEGVRIYPEQPLSTSCRCSRTRIQDMLVAMSEADRREMLVEGTIAVHCHFCNKEEHFTASDVGL